MLTDIRKLSDHFLFKFFSLLIVVSFVSWGISDILRDKADKHLVIFKNERPILTEEFLRAKQERIKHIQNVVKSPLTEEQLTSLDIDNIVLDGLINERMVSHIKNYYELNFSDENMISEIKKTQAFFDSDGKFSYEIFHDIIRRNGFSESKYLSSMKEDIASKMIFNVFDHPIFPVFLSQQVAKYLNTEVTFDIVKLEPSWNNQTVSDNDIKEFYAKHKDEFITQELRDIEYIEISPDLVKVKISDDEIRAFYNENIADYNSPAFFSFYDIITDSKEKSEEIVKILKSASNIKEIKNITGKSVSEYFKENVIEEKLDSQVASLLKSQELVSVLKVANQYHILKKEIYIPAKLVGLKDARKDIELVLRQKKFDTEFGYLVRNIDDFVASAENLEQVSKKFGLILKHRNAILKIDGDQISAKAFEIAHGDFSEVFELASGNSAILFLKNIVPSRLRGFDEAKYEIRQKLQKDAAYSEAHKKLNHIRASANEANFTKLCEKSGLVVESSKKMTMAKLNAGMLESYPEELIRELFSIKDGNTGSVFEYDGKIYLAKLRAKSYGRYVEYEKINSTIAKNYQSSVVDEIFIFLRKDSGVNILK